MAESGRSAGAFQAVVSILDRFSAPLHVFNERLRESQVPLEKLRMSGAKLSHQFHELGERTGLATLAEGAKALGEHLHGALESAMEMAPAIGALGAAAGAAGLVELAVKAGELGESLDLVHDRTGLAVETLSTLHFAASRAKVESGAADAAVERLNRTLGQIATGKGKEAAGLLKALGIHARDAKGHIRQAADILPQLFEAFEKNKLNKPLEEQMASKLFGQKTGGAMIPLLNKGPKFYEEMTEKAKRFGMVFSDSQAQSGHHFAEVWADMKSAVDGLLTAIGFGLQPVLERVIEPLTEFLAENRELIASKVTDTIIGFADALRRINWSSAIRAVETIGGTLEWIGEKLGPSGIVYTGFFALGAITLGPLIRGLLKVSWILTVNLIPQMAKFAALLGGELLLNAGLAADAIGAGGLAGALGSAAAFFEAGSILAFASALGTAAIAAIALYEALHYIKDVQGDLKTGAQNLGSQELSPGIIGSIIGTTKWINRQLGLGDEGGDTAGGMFPNSGSSSTMPDLRGLLGGGNGAAPGPGVRGETDVRIRFDNAPPGMRIFSSKSRNMASPQVEIGSTMLSQGI